MPRAVERDQVSAGCLRKRPALNVRTDQVTIAVDHECGAAHPCAGVSEQFLAGDSDSEDGVEDRLWCRLERPADAVLDLLGGVRFVEASPEEELQKTEVVALQQTTGRRPFGVGLDCVFERRDIAFWVVGHKRHPGADVHDALDAFRVLSSENGCPQRPGRERDQRGSLRGGGVHDHERVVRELGRAIRLGSDCAVRAPVAPAVEGDYSTVARQIRNLRFPEPRVDDRPSRQQQHCRLAVAVALPEHAHAVSLDVSGLVRVASAGLLRGGGVGYLNQGHLLQRTLPPQRASSVKTARRPGETGLRFPSCHGRGCRGVWRSSWTVARPSGVESPGSRDARLAGARAACARARSLRRGPAGRGDSFIRGHFLAAAARLCHRAYSCAPADRLTQLEIAVVARVPMNKHTPPVLLRQPTRTHRSAGY